MVCETRLFKSEDAGGLSEGQRGLGKGRKRGQRTQFRPVPYATFRSKFRPSADMLQRSRLTSRVVGNVDRGKAGHERRSQLDCFSLRVGMRGTLSPPHFGASHFGCVPDSCRARASWEGKKARRWASRPFLILRLPLSPLLLSFLPKPTHTHTYSRFRSVKSTAVPYSSPPSDQLAPPDFPNFPHQVVVSHSSRLSPSSRSSQLAGNGRTRLPQCSYAPGLEAQ